MLRETIRSIFFTLLVLPVLLFKPGRGFAQNLTRVLPTGNAISKKCLIAIAVTPLPTNFLTISDLRYAILISHAGQHATQDAENAEYQVLFWSKRYNLLEGFLVKRSNHGATYEAYIDMDLLLQRSIKNRNEAISIVQQHGQLFSLALVKLNAMGFHLPQATSQPDSRDATCERELIH